MTINNLYMSSLPILFFFFFNDTATTEIYTLSLHDALPISRQYEEPHHHLGQAQHCNYDREKPTPFPKTSHTNAGNERWCEMSLEMELVFRSEEHTSELQSHSDLVCRLLLEKTKTMRTWSRL